MPSTPAADITAATSTPSLPPSTTATTTTYGTPLSIDDVAIADADVATTNPQPCCNWSILKCHIIGLPLIKYWISALKKYAHHVCPPIEWVKSRNLPEGGLGQCVKSIIHIVTTHLYLPTIVLCQQPLALPLSTHQTPTMTCPPSLMMSEGNIL